MCVCNLEISYPIFFCACNCFGSNSKSKFRTGPPPSQEKTASRTNKFTKKTILPMNSKFFPGNNVRKPTLDLALGWLVHSWQTRTTHSKSLSLLRETCQEGRYSVSLTVQGLMHPGYNFCAAWRTPFLGGLRMQQHSDHKFSKIQSCGNTTHRHRRDVHSWIHSSMRQARYAASQHAPPGLRSDLRWHEKDSQSIIVLKEGCSILLPPYMWVAHGQHHHPIESFISQTHER